MMYSTVQTGPKIELGGVQDGLFNDVYHSPGRNREPTHPAAKHTSIQIAKLERLLPISRASLFRIMARPHCISSGHSEQFNEFCLGSSDQV